MSHTATMTDGSEKTYLSCAETAKLLRAQLKKAFPGVKFSVRSKVYSGGASIDVSYTDGPTTDAVDAVCQPFKGGDFDGMVDLKISNVSWLTPDGVAGLARGGGGGSTIPEFYGDAPGPTAKLVHFGADFIFTRRDHSPEFKANVKATFEEKLGYSLPDKGDNGYYETKVPLAVTRDGELLRMVDSDTDYLSDIYHRYTHYLEA